MTIISDAFWVFVLGLVACFAFFFAIGAVTAESVGLVVVMCGLGVAWLVHAWLAGRHHDAHDPRMTSARERRGF